MKPQGLSQLATPNSTRNAPIVSFGHSVILAYRGSHEHQTQSRDSKLEGKETSPQELVDTGIAGKQVRDG